MALSGGAALLKRLQEIVDNVGKDAEPTLRVGFLEDAKYPDGTSVAMVAAIQNYGAPAAGIPARPYFTNLVTSNRGKWGEQLGKIAKAANYDINLTFGRMGVLMAGQLQTAIVKMTDPPLKPETISRKGFAKPLIETAHMVNSVQYEYSGAAHDAPSKIPKP